MLHSSETTSELFSLYSYPSTERKGKEKNSRKALREDLDGYVEEQKEGQCSWTTVTTGEHCTRNRQGPTTEGLADINEDPATVLQP